MARLAHSGVLAAALILAVGLTTQARLLVENNTHHENVATSAVSNSTDHHVGMSATTSASNASLIHRRQDWEQVLLGEALLCPEFIPLPPCAFYFNGIGPMNVPIFNLPIISNTALLSSSQNGDHPVTLDIITDVSGAGAGGDWWGALMGAVFGQGKGQAYKVEVDAVGCPLYSNCLAAKHPKEAKDQFYANGEVR